MRVLAFILLTCALASCALPMSHEQSSQAASQRLEQARQQVGIPVAPQHLVREQGYFVPPLSLPAQEGPAWFNEDTFAVFDQYSLRRALLDLLNPVGVSVRLLDDINDDMLITMRHDGSLGSALEQIALMTGLAFTHEERLVTVRQFEMAEFDVAFLAGSTNFFLGDDRQQQGMSGRPDQPGGINDDPSQFINFTSEALSVWDDLLTALNLLLSERGSVALNQSTTSVLVRDYPQHVQLVREYLVQQNQRLSRQVAIDVQVIDVSFVDNQQSGIDWDLLYQAAEQSGVVNFSTGLSATTGLSQLSVQAGNGRFDGSQVLLQALSEQGVVEVSNHPRLVSLNNQISKIVLEDNATYLASAGSSATANVGTSDLLIPGVVTTGFELYLLPKVANAQVLMQLSTSLSDLKRIDQITSGDTTIQTPHTNRKKFFMKAMVADGETLLISGLKSSRQARQQERTLGSMLFGGRRRSTNERSETILLLTPRILSTGAML